MTSRAPLLVAAIDFGTTFSGYAFSFRHDYERDPLKISCNNWVAGGRGLVSLKTPSTILLDSDRKFHSFGYEAENKYSELTEEDDHHDWLYFKRFKMLLHNNRDLRRSTKIKDINGKSMSAMVIFSMAIRYLREHLLETIHLQMDGFSEDMIGWVLTVPAIWDDGAKQFMREAAKDAGIDNDKLTLALEPEAASLYCMKQPMTKLTTVNQKTSFVEFEVGTKYMVIDIGGGTVDITIHEIISSGKIREIQAASGGSFGGTNVDSKFNQFLVKLFGNDVLTELKAKCMQDYLDLFRDFETKKRTLKPNSEGRMVFRIPFLLMQIFKATTDEELDKSLLNSPFSDTVSIRGDKILVDILICKEFFREACDGITESAEQALETAKEVNISKILLVGGFSESQMIQHAIRHKFPGKTVVSPGDAGLAVLKGAVLFGHEPDTIKSRVMKYSYGVEVNQHYDPDIHPDVYKFWQANKSRWMCRYCFDPFVKAGDEVEVGSTVTNTYGPEEKDSIEGIGIFASTKVPRFIKDPSCFRLGAMYIKMPNGGWPLHASLKVEMKFGGTEFTVTITDEWFGDSYSDSFDFIK
ncbi:heat shock 70 kDa protein 12B-like [Ylistrum balloti]|uniref:heat shock 70 kDa protein 12B-like n=1 Tax=Ylistrum balloti TaxID=509963 RepID=UPI002905BAB5|nr:heat shock 70 kDa protein 12B-like [Ylistrum balloti]